LRAEREKMRGRTYSESEMRALTDLAFKLGADVGSLMTSPLVHSVLFGNTDEAFSSAIGGDARSRG
ncbi:MAG TPA: hypothetical protein VME42_13290, partial [Steroidobacteraceae bacterium]|nr:hypothetical protein [Steroidobacteraceae bacterium]